MEPLRVTALLQGAISLPTRHLALDSLLASQVAIRRGLPPPRHASDCEPIEIPVEREPAGRFHLCSVGLFEVASFGRLLINQRPPVDEIKLLGEQKGRVNVTTGEDKAYRFPFESLHLKDNRIEWFCVGDAAGIRELLYAPFYLGHKRSRGLGKVVEWRVETCETWGGFPVVRDGLPLRALPLDWPGLSDQCNTGYRCLSYPFWDHSKEVLCVCPE